LPQISYVTEGIKGQARQLVQDLQNFGFMALPLYPMGLYLDPDVDHSSISKISQKLRIGLASSTPEELEWATNALIYWLAFSHRHDLPTPSPDLLGELVTRVFTRRQPGLNFSLNSINSLMDMMPELFSSEHLDKLCIGLEYLLKETKFPCFEELKILLGHQQLPLIPTSERRLYRQYCSCLANHIYHLLKDNGRNIPEILIAWKNDSEIDILPEVRKIWEE
jgi:hypothetical protein